MWYRFKSGIVYRFAFFFNTLVKYQVWMFLLPVLIRQVGDDCLLSQVLQTKLDEDMTLD